MYNRQQIATYKRLDSQKSVLEDIMDHSNETETEVTVFAIDPEEKVDMGIGKEISDKKKGGRRPH